MTAIRNLGRRIAPLAALLAAAHSTASPATGKAAMDESPRALTLELRLAGGEVELAVIGAASTAVTVDYVLEVEGGSRTRHAGRTGVRPGAPQRLSTVRLRTAAPWTARLSVIQGDGQRYELTAQGPAGS